MPRKQLVTLITDFGSNDYYLGVMKGVILGINPEALIVDVCHHVTSYDIFDAAFTLAQSYRYFPSDTIHLVVVDPGVGTARRPILARTIDQKFVAPDNGVLSLVYEREENIEVRHVTSDHYFLSPISQTFQGRDIFAPIAGWLSKGVEVDKFGEPITDYAKFTPPKAKRVDEQVVQGVTLRIDKFGNIVTNISPEDVPQLFTENPPPFRIMINQQEVTKLYPNFAAGKPTEVFAIVGSTGYIEICTNRGSAAKSLNATRGMEVGVIVGPAGTPPA